MTGTLISHFWVVEKYILLTETRESGLALRRQGDILSHIFWRTSTLDNNIPMTPSYSVSACLISHFWVVEEFISFIETQASKLALRGQAYILSHIIWAIYTLDNNIPTTPSHSVSVSFISHFWVVEDLILLTESDASALALRGRVDILSYISWAISSWDNNIPMTQSYSVSASLISHFWVVEEFILFMETRTGALALRGRVGILSHIIWAISTLDYNIPTTPSYSMSECFSSHFWVVEEYILLTETHASARALRRRADILSYIFWAISSWDNNIPMTQSYSVGASLISHFWVVEEFISFIETQASKLALRRQAYILSHIIWAISTLYYNIPTTPSYSVSECFSSHFSVVEEYILFTETHASALALRRRAEVLSYMFWAISSWGNNIPMTQSYSVSAPLISHFWVVEEFISFKESRKSKLALWGRAYILSHIIWATSTLDNNILTTPSYSVTPSLISHFWVVDKYILLTETHASALALRGQVDILSHIFWAISSWDNNIPIALSYSVSASLISHFWVVEEFISFIETQASKLALRRQAYILSHIIWAISTLYYNIPTTPSYSVSECFSSHFSVVEEYILLTETHASALALRRRAEVLSYMFWAISSWGNNIPVTQSYSVSAPLISHFWVVEEFISFIEAHVSALTLPRRVNILSHIFLVVSTLDRIIPMTPSHLVSVCLISHFWLVGDLISFTETYPSTPALRGRVYILSRILWGISTLYRIIPMTSSHLVSVYPISHFWLVGNLISFTETHPSTPALQKQAGLFSHICRLSFILDRRNPITPHCKIWQSPPSHFGGVELFDLALVIYVCTSALRGCVHLLILILRTCFSLLWANATTGCCTINDYLISHFWPEKSVDCCSCPHICSSWTSTSTQTYFLLKRTGWNRLDCMNGTHLRSPWMCYSRRITLILKIDTPNPNPQHGGRPFGYVFEKVTRLRASAFSGQLTKIEHFENFLNCRLFIKYVIIWIFLEFCR